MKNLGFVSMKKLGDAVSSFISNHIELWDHFETVRRSCIRGLWSLFKL